MMEDIFMYDDELYHHGIKGMRWGIRRYQNKDGSLTPAGKKRYSNVQNPNGSLKLLRSDSKTTRATKRDYNRMSDSDFTKKYGTSKEKYLKSVRKYTDPGRSALSKIGVNLKKAAYTAANIGTLGTVGSIKKHEDKMQRYRKAGARAKSAWQIGMKSISYGLGSVYAKYGYDYLKLMLAAGASYAYLKSGRNQTVKKGAMIVGRYFNVATKASLAAYAGYGAYDVARTAKDVYDSKMHKNDKSKKGRKS